REGGGAGGGGQQPPFVNQVAEGRGVSEALRIVAEHSPRVLHLGHLQVVLVSEELARAGLGPLLDYLTSEREARRVVQLAVSSCPPRDVLEVRTQLENLPGISVAEELRHLPETVGLPESPIVRFLNAIQDEGVEPVLPVVHRVDAGGKILERLPGAGEEAGQEAGPGGAARGRGAGRTGSREGGQSGGGGREAGGESPVTVRVAGVAIFKDDRMVGTLNDLEARGLAWLMGKVERGILVVPAPLAGPGPAILHVNRVQARVEPRLAGAPSVRVRVKVRAGVLEMLSPTYDLTPQDMDRLEQAAARTLADEIMATMRRVQKEFRSDVYGFGWAFYRRYPRVWRQDLGPRWDQVFPDLPVDLEVKVHIVTTFFSWRSPLGPSR
ncbi:MAG: Ger(x)C family spore germination protein, partial [Bacillota bacterium]